MEGALEGFAALDTNQPCRSSLCTRDEMPTPAAIAAK